METSVRRGGGNNRGIYQSRRGQQEEGRRQEEGRQADFLYDLCYDQPLREIGTLAARRRGTFLRPRVRCVAASAVNVDCSPRPTVPAARSARPPLPGTASTDSTEEASLMAAILGPTYITAGPLRVC